MAADAINVSETTYLTAVRYYLANLGTTMESQVRSSVGPSHSVESPYSVDSVYPDYSVLLCRESTLLTLSSPCALLCAAPSLSLPRDP